MLDKSNDSSYLNYCVIAHFLISKHRNTKSANAFIIIASSHIMSHVNLAESLSVLKDGVLSTINLKTRFLSIWLAEQLHQNDLHLPQYLNNKIYKFSQKLTFSCIYQIQFLTDEH